MSTNSNPIKLATLNVKIAAQKIQGESSIFLNCDYIDLCSGVWQIAVKDVICKSTHEPIFLKIATNLVVGQYDKDNERKPVPIGQLYLTAEKLFTFNPLIWFQITQKIQELRVWVILDKTQNANIDFLIDVLLQRVA
jgi:hypothetical protein